MLIYLQAIIIGLTQGLTEFIPVSSSGHLIVVGHLLNFSGSSLAFDVALNIGTLTALLIFFWRDFWSLAGGLFGKNEQTKLAWMLVVGTIPAVILGFLLQGPAETIFRSNALVAINLIGIAVVMLLADKFYRGTIKLGDMTAPRAIRIGFAQALALVPGVSRSGITISAGMFEGFDRVSAVRFSFLLSAPVIAGATMKVLLSGDSLNQLGGQLGVVITAILASFVGGYFAISFMLRYLSRHGLSVFAYYRLAVGVLVLLFMR